MKTQTLKKTTPLLVLAFLLFFFSSAEVDNSDKNAAWYKQMKVAETSTVLLNNRAGLVPVTDLENNKIASVNINTSSTVFDSVLNFYTKVSSFSSAAYSNDPDFNKLNFDLKLFKTVIVRVSDQSIKESRTQKLITDLNTNKQVIVVLSGDVAALKNLDTIDCPVLWTSENTPVTASFTAQVIFGGIETTAHLAENVSLKFKKGDGYNTTATRLKYTVPEESGIKTADLEGPIRKIMDEAISAHATPGGVVMVVKDGKVIFNQAYGTRLYKADQPDNVQDIFDLASVSKITATTIATMRLYDEKKIRLDTNLGAYLPLARATSKNTLKIRELLLHEAGLTPYIPFHESLKQGDFSRDSSSLFSVKVADNFYIRRGYYEEVMLPRMLNTKLGTRGRYEYSDLSMYFMKEAIERQAKEKLDQYVLNHFYLPLGMQTAGFNPRNRFEKARLVPTENDLSFRRTLVQGYVHDQGAALAGGVAGHAGVFASSNDLAILFQMLLNGGTYGGHKYFSPETINLFTTKQSATSRRGLGFDRWDPEVKTYPSTLASPQTYGHTGFTGTCVWVDPKYNLIYIFLSNRVYDQAANKLNSMKIRARIQDVIYQAIEKSGK